MVKNKNEMISMIKNPGRASDVTTFMMRLCSLACTIIGGTWCFGLAAMMWSFPSIFTVEPWYQLVFGIFLVAISGYSAFLSKHRIAVLLLVPIGVLVVKNIYDTFISSGRELGGWPFFTVVQYAYGLILLAGAIFAILHLIFVSVRRVEIRRASVDLGENAISVLRQDWKKFKPIHLGFLFMIVGSGILNVALIFNWFIPTNATITLHPANYQVKFQFYGQVGYNDYNDTERTLLNATGVRIIAGVADFISYQNYQNDPYMWWMNLTSFEQTAAYKNIFNYINSTFYPWKVNDSRVTFLFLLEGIPSGFPTDYSVTAGYWGVGATLLNAWLAAHAIVEANLTNVVGFSTDQESVSGDYKPVGGALNASFTLTADPERAAQARANYLEFFKMLHYEETTNATWKTFFSSMNKTHGIDHFLFTTTYGGVTVDAGLAGGNLANMNTLALDPVNTIPYDEFLPMLYFQSDFPPDRANYDLYQMMQILKTTLQEQGYEHRMGVILGCMGQPGSMYLQNYTGSEYVNGSQHVVNGFDAIASEVMIAKAFNVTWVTFFPYEVVPGMFWGVLGGYGGNFLARLNATVNGPGASASFQIKYTPNVLSSVEDLAQVVFLANPGWAWFYLIAFIAAVMVVSFHHAWKPRER